MLKTLLAGLLLAASTSLLAQAPQGDAGKAPRKARFDCSQAKDPKACEENRAKLKAAHEKASKACESAKGAEHGACMRKEMCAQSQDPAKCEARASSRCPTPPPCSSSSARYKGLQTRCQRRAAPRR